MNNTVKRALSLLLCLLLGLSLLPTAFASEPTANESVKITYENFPDEAFRAYINDEFDYIERDDTISEEQIAAAKEMNVYGKGIRSLKGVEFFTALTSLSCGKNQLTSMDLSKNTALSYLGCQNNELSSLDLSKNTALDTLTCNNNQLSSMDLSKNTALTSLTCSSNLLTSLDLSRNTALESLNCSANHLSALKLGQCAALRTVWCYNNELTALDLSGCPALDTLWCYGNQLTRVYVHPDAPLSTVYTDSGVEIFRGAPAGKPAAPKLTGKLSSGKPKLSWKAVAGAESYEIYRSATGETSGFKLVDTVTGTSWTHDKAASGKAYWYKVRGVTYEGKKGTFSAVVKVTMKPAAPKPTVKLSDGKPKLSWKAVTGAAEYEIWRSMTGEAGSFKRVATVTGTSWTHSKATAGKTYYYKVRAVSADGLKSAYSSVAVKTARPKAPAVTGSLSAKGKPVLSWKAVTGAVEYRIYRSTSKNGTYKLIKTTSSLKYTNTKAEAGTTYYYKVKAVTADGVRSVYSAVVKLKAQ